MSHNRWTATTWLSQILSSPTPLDFDGLLRPSSRCALQAAEGACGSVNVTAAALDFNVHGGTMGRIEGEGLVQCALHAATQRHAMVVVTSSGGVRVQEGVRALLHMPRIALAREQLAQVHKPLIAICEDPTMGGVSASVVAMADVVMGVAGARIGFTGEHIKVRAGGASGILRSEAAHQAGLIDMVCEREHVGEQLSHLLFCLTAG